MNFIKKRNESKNATFPEKGIYLAYLLGQNIAFQVTLVILTVYWQSTLGIEPIIVGTITLVARIWDAVNDPILGGVVQKVGKTKYGLYKPWTFVSSFLLPLVIIMIFSAPFGVETTGTAIWAGLSYILFQMIYTVTDIPIFSLSMTMEPDTKKRVKLLFFGRWGAGIAGIITSLIFFGITNSLSHAGWVATNAYLLASGIAAILTFVTMIPIFLVRERNIVVGEKITLKKMAIFVGTNKHLLKAMICMVGGTLFSMIWMSTTPYLISEYTNGNTDVMMPLNGVLLLLVSLALMPILLKLGTKKGVVTLLLVGIVITTIGVLIVWSTKNQYSLLVMMLGAGIISQTPMTTVMGRLTQETIEYGKYHTEEKQEALGFAAQTFTAKASIGFGGLIASSITTAAGFLSKLDAKGDPIPQKPIVLERLLWISYGLLIFTAIISILIFTFVYNLRTKQVQVMAAFNRGEISKEEADKKIAVMIKQEKAQKWYKRL